MCSYHNIRKHLDLDLILGRLNSALNFADCSGVPEGEETLVYFLLEEVSRDIKRIMDRIFKYKDRNKKLDAELLEIYINMRYREINREPINYGCDCGECMDCGIADDYCKNKFNKTRAEMIKANEE